MNHFKNITFQIKLSFLRIIFTIYQFLENIKAQQVLKIILDVSFLFLINYYIYSNDIGYFSNTCILKYLFYINIF